MTRDIPIRGEMIRLGQILKLADLADGGGEVKNLLAGGAIFVNGEHEDRRGRQLHGGDLVRVGGVELRVVTGD